MSHPRIIFDVLKASALCPRIVYEQEHLETRKERQEFDSIRANGAFKTFRAKWRCPTCHLVGLVRIVQTAYFLDHDDGGEGQTWRQFITCASCAGDITDAELQNIMDRRIVVGR